MSLLVSTSKRQSKLRESKTWATRMTEGKTGGAFSMNFLSNDDIYDNTNVSSINNFHNARTPPGVPYTINPNLWCMELLPQLTCCPIHKDDSGTSFNGISGQAWRQRYGGVAITKRHILGCAHAYSHAQGTWINGNTTNYPPTIIRFIDQNGEIVDRKLLHQAVDPLNADLHVAVLDEDLPDSIHIPPVAASNTLYELTGYQKLYYSQEYQPGTGIGILFGRYTYYTSDNTNGIYYDANEVGIIGEEIFINHVVSGTGTDVSISINVKNITITHGSNATLNSIISAINSNITVNNLITARLRNISRTADVSRSGYLNTLVVPVSDYPSFNRQMFWVSIPNFNYAVWSGDSGTPIFCVINNEVIISGILSGSSSDLHSRSTITWATRLNGIIAQADANAISIGRMVSPTGYTVNTYNKSV